MTKDLATDKNSRQRVRVESRELTPEQSQSLRRDDASLVARHAQTDPQLVSRQGVMQLQRAIGNQAVTRLLAGAGNGQALPAGRHLQRETFLEQRQVRSHYVDEETVQRPDLLTAITNAANKVKELYLNYQHAVMTGEADDVKEAKRKLWQDKLKFLRKQDVTVSDKGEVDPASLTNRLVEYDKTPQAQAATKVSLGAALRRQDGAGPPVDTAESVTFQKGLGWEIFVMSPGGDIHMASHKIGLYHHSSLLGGGNVAAAGMMRVSGGAIQELNNHSGHYAPEDKHVRNVLKRLSQAGNSLNFDLEIAGANPFRGRAADYWKPQDQGGQGGQVTYDRHRTAQILSHFNNTLGRNRVDQAFTSAGWTVTRPNPKSVNIAKPDGTIPSFEEIQVQLTTHFAAEQQPPATVTQKD